MLSVNWDDPLTLRQEVVRAIATGSQPGVTSPFLHTSRNVEHAHRIRQRAVSDGRSQEIRVVAVVAVAVIQVVRVEEE